MGDYHLQIFRRSSEAGVGRVLAEWNFHAPSDKEAIDYAKANHMAEFDSSNDFATLWGGGSGKPIWERDDRNA